MHFRTNEKGVERNKSITQQKNMLRIMGLTLSIGLLYAILLLTKTAVYKPVISIYIQ